MAHAESTLTVATAERDTAGGGTEEVALSLEAGSGGRAPEAVLAPSGKGTPPMSRKMPARGTGAGPPAWWQAGPPSAAM